MCAAVERMLRSGVMPLREPSDWKPQYRGLLAWKSKIRYVCSSDWVVSGKKMEPLAILAQGLQTPRQ
jgi:hypothetical protein